MLLASCSALAFYVSPLLLLLLLVMYSFVKSIHLTPQYPTSKTATGGRGICRKREFWYTLVPNAPNDAKLEVTKCLILKPSKIPLFICGFLAV